MIMGENRPAVIQNIRSAVEREDFYAKVELHDPVLTPEEAKAVTGRYLAARGTAAYKTKAFAARTAANLGSWLINRDTQITGGEKAAGLTGGAILTSNHFSPLENTVIRRYVRMLGKKRLNIVSQVTNHAMTGPVGFLMRYADTIPLDTDPHYMGRDFMDVLAELTGKGEMVLIYPEQEMWFYYRKPRPPKRGAYCFAAKLGLPVVSCFVEITDRPEMDAPDFHKVKYTLHVLDVLYPDPEKNVRENSRELCQRDYALKKAAYEAAYGKPLTYAFEDTDIAGWTGPDHG